MKFCFLGVKCILFSFFLKDHLLFPIIIIIIIFFLSNCMSWIVFLKMGKCLPGSFTVMLATISSADECADKIIEFTDAHTPGAQELVTFLSGFISSLFFAFYFF